MLLDVDLTSKIAERIRGKRLKDFGLDERAFQEILYNSLDKLIPDDEFILLMQSRRWQEEPDLMAIDKEGRLFIFELKAWESHSENILQVLRYADSTRKCNSGELGLGIEEHLVRSSESQRFSWPMIEPVHDEVKLLIGDGVEPSGLGQVLPDQAVDVFIQAPLV
jgi:hypothetical protein